MYEPLARPDYYGASAPSRPSTDDASIPPTQMASGPQERSGMVPVFTENRSIGLAPSSAPAASPRLRRRPSPWPPRRHRIPATESTAQHARSCATSRPISTRFESVTRLRSFNTGSSRIPSDLARRTRPAWQSQAIPALSALLTALPSVSWIRLRSAPTRLLRQPSEEAFHLLRFPAPHGALRPHVALCVSSVCPAGGLAGLIAECGSACMYD